jgi:hypothetical protein
LSVSTFQSVERILLKQIEQAITRRIPALTAPRDDFSPVSRAEESVRDKESRQINCIEDREIASQAQGGRNKYLLCSIENDPRSCKNGDRKAINLL